MTIQIRSFLTLALAASAVFASADFRQAEAGGPGEPDHAKHMLEAMPGMLHSPDAILVRFKANASEPAKAAVRASIGGSKLRSYTVVPGLELVSTSSGPNRAIVSLRGNPAVLYVEPDYVIQPTVVPNDPFFSNLWGLNDPGNVDINAPQAWDIFTGDPNFVVAVIDTGIQMNHPDLMANLWTNPRDNSYNGSDDDGNGYTDDVHGWNFYDHNNDPSDTAGHGTHTSGTIGAVGNNGIGVSGVNWRCKIMPLKFIGANGGFESDAVAAIQYAVRNGARLSNNSWGANNYMASLYDAVNQARSAGHLFVAAAGNNGVNAEGLPFYPACFDLDNIISVAAVDRTGNRASFSNWGMTSVDIAAPGDQIYSTYLNGGYANLSGTSMASPHVAGVAALVWGRNPLWSYQQVRDRLFSTARPIGNLNGLIRTGGIVDAFAAIQGSVNQAPQVTILQPIAGGTFTYGSWVFFSDSARDPEDGDLSASTVWTSDLQGYVASGTGFWFGSLAVGTHHLTATVHDSRGATGSATVVVTVQQVGSIPVAPTSTTAWVNPNGTVTIHWQDNSNNETAFEIQREVSVGLGWKGLTAVGPAGANWTSFTETPPFGGLYHYRVRAVNAFGVSAWSDWAQVKVP